MAHAEPRWRKGELNKGALHPKKISGRLCFDREELIRVLANGDHKKGRGRPRKGWVISKAQLLYS